MASRITSNSDSFEESLPAFGKASFLACKSDQYGWFTNGRLVLPFIIDRRLIFKRLQIHGIQVAMYSDAGVQVAWQEIMDLIQPQGANVLIDKIYPFEDVPTAFEHLKKGPMGKVLIGPMNQ